MVAYQPSISGVVAMAPRPPADRQTISAMTSPDTCFFLSISDSLLFANCERGSTNEIVAGRVKKKGLRSLLFLCLHAFLRDARFVAVRMRQQYRSGNQCLVASYVTLFRFLMDIPSAIVDNQHPLVAAPRGSCHDSPQSCIHRLLSIGK